MAAFRNTRRFRDEDDDRYGDIPLRFDDRRSPDMSAAERKVLVIVSCWAVPMIGLFAILVETIGRVAAA